MGRDVLESGGCPGLRDLESEVPEVLAGWHLCAAEFEQAFVKFENHETADVFALFEHDGVFDKVLCAELHLRALVKDVTGRLLLSEVRLLIVFVGLVDLGAKNTDLVVVDARG